MTSRRFEDAPKAIRNLMRRVDELSKLASRKGHGHGSNFDFDSNATGGNSATFTGSFATVLTLSYTPPADWSTYKLQARGGAWCESVNAGDNLQARIEIDGAQQTGMTENSQATDRWVPAQTGDESGLSGSVDVELTLRNTTASRGLAGSSYLDVIAVRES